MHALLRVCNNFILKNLVLIGILILLDINKAIYYSDRFVADAITFLSFPYTFVGMISPVKTSPESLTKT